MYITNVWQFINNLELCLIQYFPLQGITYNLTYYDYKTHHTPGSILVCLEKYHTVANTIKHEMAKIDNFAFTTTNI